MRAIITLYLVALSLTLFAQVPVDQETGKHKYDLVFEVPEVTQEDIYKRAKGWIVRNLKSADNIVQLDDEEKSSITATGNILLDDVPSWCRYRNVTLNFKFTVFVKEGRYKVIIDNFHHSYIKDCNLPGNESQTLIESDLEKIKGFGKKERAKELEEINTRFTQLLAELKKTITTGGDSADDDW